MVNLFFIMLQIPLTYPLGSSSSISLVTSPLPELYITLSVIKLRSDKIARGGASDKISLPIRSRESYSIPNRLERVGKISRLEQGLSTVTTSFIPLFHNIKLFL